MITKLKEYRKRDAMKQTELARAVKADQSTISDIERGQSIPLVTLALKLARALDTTVEDLFQLEPGD